eukprot:1144125-Pelagomonas_calceolata.AAC.1
MAVRTIVAAWSRANATGEEEKSAGRTNAVPRSTMLAIKPSTCGHEQSSKQIAKLPTFELAKEALEHLCALSDQCMLQAKPRLFLQQTQSMEIKSKSTRFDPFELQELIHRSVGRVKRGAWWGAWEAWQSVLCPYG